MSENGKSKIAEIASQGNIIITVILDPSTGGITVNGPLQDKVLCFGLLECGKQAIIDHHKQADSRILVARPAVSR